MTTRTPATDIVSVSVMIARTTNGPAGKLADAELHFTVAPLAGLKLLGFGIWSARNGGLTVTFPARQYSTDGTRRTFTLLRNVAGREASETLRDLILRAYAETRADEAALGTLG